MLFVWPSLYEYVFWSHCRDPKILGRRYVMSVHVTAATDGSHRSHTFAIGLCRGKETVLCPPCAQGTRCSQSCLQITLLLLPTSRLTGRRLRRLRNLLLHVDLTHVKSHQSMTCLPREREIPLLRRSPAQWQQLALSSFQGPCS